MPRRDAARLALALAACALGAARADFAFASFSLDDAPDAQLRLVGVANRTGDRLRLTPPQAGTAGALWCASWLLDSSCAGCLRGMRLALTVRRSRYRRLGMRSSSR